MKSTTRDHRKPNPFPKNWEIKGKTVRIVTNTGSDEVDKQLAISHAKKRQLDLVQIATGENGLAICKIIDFGRFKYELEKTKKKEKAHRIKEIQVRPTTDPHDLETKLKHAREFLAEENQVVFRLRFKGREKAHKEVGVAMLKNIQTQIGMFAKFDPLHMTDNLCLLRAHPARNTSPPKAE